MSRGGQVPADPAVRHDRAVKAAAARWGRRHVLRFRGLADGSIRVVCDDCRPRWARTFEPGHTDRDWAELSRQHSGTLHVEGDGPVPVASRAQPR